MCGRFMLDSDIEDLLHQYRILKREVDDYKKGDIYPSGNAPIVMDDNDRTLKSVRWGFPIDGKNKLVINARSESVVDKPMFKNSFNNARCIIPANLFYEWKDEGNKKKTKHEIYLRDKSTISLGGILKFLPNNTGDKELFFVILTTEANNHMKGIHSRMPLIIKNDAFDYWLDNDSSLEIIKEIIKSNKGHRFIIERNNKEQTGEQLRLF